MKYVYHEVRCIQWWLMASTFASCMVFGKTYNLFESLFLVMKVGIILLRLLRELGLFNIYLK